MVAPGTSSVGPPPTPTIQPLTHAVHPSPTPEPHPSTTPAADPLPPPVIITPTPPPVVITPTPLPDPTSIPSSSSIPPSETVTPSADPDSSGDGEGLDPPLHDRPWIEPYGKGFIPSRIASQAITRSIKQQFLSPWPTWGAISNDDRKPFWERFQAQALGRAVHVDEVFAQTHVRKGTNQFVDERSRKNHEEFSTRLSQVRSEHESAPTPDDGNNAEDDILLYTLGSPICDNSSHSPLASFPVEEPGYCVSPTFNIYDLIPFTGDDQQDNADLRTDLFQEGGTDGEPSKDAHRESRRQSKSGSRSRDYPLSSQINTISRGFTRGRSSSSTWKRHLRSLKTIHLVDHTPKSMPSITFTDEDFKASNPNQDDHMVIMTDITWYSV
ncbi:hypothetical protein LR48_Vigan05g087600 [Vigna angularis]|uniref:Uncharacterized protein n=1 Tax=Phaseolus angularis TaxID=3914 RepID=A0A0L9UL21_PHAAN|nr:hypothetical protein LR48_Vigan05g087600 [Vigna angularis]